MPEVVVGFVAGLLSALAYGSFAVPIKAKTVVDAKSYKSLMCFLSAWIVLAWAEFRFTWWATLAAVIWVTNGVLAIISIHLAGLGVAQTLWSCVSIFVSFAWGKLFFKEPIANVALSFTGLALMVTGMLGLGWVASKFDASSQPGKEPKAVAVAVVDEIFADSLEPEDVIELKEGRAGDLERQRLFAAADSSDPLFDDADSSTLDGSGSTSRRKPNDALELDDPGGNVWIENIRKPTTSGLIERRASGLVTETPLQHHKFALGVVVATLVGVLAGSMMVCLKMAPTGCQGDQYTVSFGIGVAGVTLAALATHTCSCFLFGRKPPSFQIRVAAGPACLAGILWSIGNYLSIVAVDHLGMVVGWPLVQCSLIVSNTWALLWYREIHGSRAVVAFFSCSGVILLGVFLLAWFGL